ncbi:MAG: pantoate--beta-alanine ligase [Betaproteobacteria bacterium]|nr:MAG: pantoate--beta-alanine ligase [Betaproteobacteria bacterium]
MPSDVITSIPQVRDRVTRARHANRRIGLVPTMGALHEGHKRLIDLARTECDLVVVSIFVNPLQFDREDDLNKYPRTLESDIDICSDSHVDVVFTPSVDEMYPSPLECVVDVGRIADHLCGRFRPGHFRGVATVVLKLFQIAQPDRAYFGQKDAQQLALIRRLVADFNVPVEIVAVPTVREPDGLALSSRNKRLKPDERQIATVLYDALRAAKSQIEAGMRDSAAVREAAERVIQKQEGVRLEYLEIVDPGDMQPVARIERPVVVAGAIWVGATRLIDNVICVPR